MNNIRLNTVGKIVRGDQVGWYILIEHDEDNTGGYYIYQAPEDNVKSAIEGFDNWLENYDDIADFFKESDWEIDWIN